MSGETNPEAGSSLQGGIDWHSYTRFLISIGLFIGGIFFAMVVKSIATWFFRDLTGIQRWISNAEIDRRLNLHEMVKHNCFGKLGHPKKNQLGVMHDYSTHFDYEDDPIEVYDDVKITFNSGMYGTGRKHRPRGVGRLDKKDTTTTTKDDEIMKFFKKKSFLYRLRGSMIDFIIALVWMGLIGASTFLAMLTINIDMSAIFTGIGFATIIALTHANDIFGGFINYLRILATGLFERGDIIEISANLGNFGGSVEGVVVNVIPGSLVLYTASPYQSLNINLRRDQGEKYISRTSMGKSMHPGNTIRKENTKTTGQEEGHATLMMDDWVNEERYFVYVSLNTIFNLPVTYHVAWKTIKQRTMVNLK